MYKILDFLVMGGGCAIAVFLLFNMIKETFNLGNKDKNMDKE